MFTSQTAHTIKQLVEFCRKLEKDKKGEGVKTVYEIFAECPATPQPMIKSIVEAVEHFNQEYTIEDNHAESITGTKQSILAQEMLEMMMESDKTTQKIAELMNKHDSQKRIE